MTREDFIMQLNSLDSAEVPNVEIFVFAQPTFN